MMNISSNIIIIVFLLFFLLSSLCVCYRTIKFQNTQKRKLVLEEEIIEEDEPEEKISKPEEKISKPEEPKIEHLSSDQKVQKKSIGASIPSKKKLAGLVKLKKDEPKKEDKPQTSGLSLLGAYSDSENSE